MSAMPNRDNPIDNRRDLVTTFIDEYALALEEARISAAHTATGGWQRLYHAHQSACLDRRRDLARRVKILANSLEVIGWTEEDEKAVKDLAKESGELRSAIAAFDRTVTERVTESVRGCEKVIEKYRAQAIRDERDTPLHNVGLAEMMRMAIAHRPRAVWDSEKGTVEIRESTHAAD